MSGDGATEQVRKESGGASWRPLLSTSLFVRVLQPYSLEEGIRGLMNPKGWVQKYVGMGSEALESDMEQLIGSKFGKEYIKAVYCHPAYLMSMQSVVQSLSRVLLFATPRTTSCQASPSFTISQSVNTSCEMLSCKMLGWMNHKLESRLLGKISTTSDTHMIPL